MNEYMSGYSKISALTDAQKGMYFECFQKPESTMYNASFAVRIPTEVNILKFETAVNKVVSKHPVFFVTIKQQDGMPVMVMGDVQPCHIEHTKASSYEEASSGFAKPFDLENGPLYHFEICQLPNEFVFLYEVHHIIYDGMSSKIFLNQIVDAYQDRDISDEEISLFDYSAIEQNITKTEEYAKAQSYYQKNFSEVEYDDCVIYDKDPSKNDVCEKISTLKIESTLNNDIMNFIKKLDITESALFMGAFAYALSLFRGSKECCFTTATHGRHDKRLKNSIGLFVKLIPLHFDIDSNGKVSDFLKRVRQSYCEGRDNDAILFSELVSAYEVKNNVGFAYQADFFSDIKLGNQSLKSELNMIGESHSDIICMVNKTKDGYEINTHYRGEVYTEGLIDSLEETMVNVLKGMLKKEYLKDISLISDSSRQFIDNFNNTKMSYDVLETVNKIIKETIEKNSKKTALVYGENEYTYEEFDRLTKSVASFIHSKEIGKDDFVAILTPRDDNGVISSWGVIRAGAAFQILDPTYPPERLNYMIKDSGAKLLIADRKLRSVLKEYDGDVLYSDEIGYLPSAIGTYKDMPESAFCIIYTSGTTGTPKGCVLENKNLVAFFHNHTKIMEIDENSNVASYASFGFDAGVMDFVTTLMAGATLYIIPDDIRLDVNEVERFYCDNEITHGFMTTQVGTMFAKQTKCKSLKVFQVGGEKLVPFVPNKNFKFLNGYGPCETMAYICHNEVKDDSLISPIGKPSPNTKLYIIDENKRLLPVGGIGQLCISGYQVGRGYLNLPEKTNSVFVENPFSKDYGFERMYLTGDTARLLPDGNIDYIGRNDSQVKIRGYRVELTEVEEVIRRFSDVKDATVTSFEESNGGKYLVAYITSDIKVDTKALSDFIGQEKPSYMVPAVIMQIESIPYNQNQKVNRKALPKPVRSVDISTFTKPNTDTQQKIYDILATVLGSNSFGVETDFLDAGLTSISSLRFNIMLGEEFNRPIKLTDIKENSTILMLEKFLANTSEEASYKREVDYPLMQNQMGIFVESTMSPASLKYNIPVMFRIDDSLDTTRLCGAVCDAINAHPYLKTILKNNPDGEIRAYRNDDLKPVVQVVKVHKKPSSSELVKPFNLLGKNLYRATIYETDEGNYLFMDFHHIVSDGMSIGILLNDINNAYEGNVIKKEQYTAYEAALEENTLRDSKKYADSEYYYERLLSDCNTECLPPKSPATDGEGEVINLEYSFGKKSEDITNYCKENKLTANAFFNAVFSYTLSKFIHSEDITYCTVYNGRNDSRLSNSFGMFVKTLPVRCVVDTRMTTLDYVKSMQNQLMDSMSNDIVSFANLSNKYKLSSDLFFNYQGDNFAFDNVGGRRAKNVDNKRFGAKAKLAVELFLEDGVYSAKVTSISDYLCEEFIDSFIDSMITASESFVREERLNKVSLLSDSAYKDFYDVMNDTFVPYEKITVYNIIDKIAINNPSGIAVKTSSSSCSYRELFLKTNSVADSLSKYGVKADEVIGVILDRSELVPISEIGIMKAGGAFLAMLPSYPDDRIDYCLKDAGCRYVIASKDIIESHANLFTNDKPYKVLAIEKLLEGNPDTSVVSSSMDSLAYCIYTSGSTGTPKGVMIEHHSLSNFVQTSALRDVESRGNTVLCMASISFDMSITEMIFSLCQGKTIYIASENEIHNFDLFKDALNKNKVDVMMMTPSFAQSLLSIPQMESAIARLRGIVLGAEAFLPLLFNKLHELNPDMLIQNGYGPTECTQVCCVKTITDSNKITIGSPFANTRFYIMDENGKILPRYACGELIICGEGVCRGYVNLPEKNKESFIFINEVKGYHSGDLVRINRDNEAEFAGRVDNQVKLRGFRIELSEIESVMDEFDGVTRSKVIVRNNGYEDFLAAFFTADKDIDIEELTTYLKLKLTYYMVPSAMMQLDKMPLTSNGKLDTKALPEINVVKKERAKRNPESVNEKKIIDIFKTVLSIEECYLDDNFFEIGGTSLTASKVIMMLKSQGIELEYQDIFDHQSAGELAEYIDSLNKEAKTEITIQDEYAYKMDSKYASLLKYNSLEYANKVRRESLGDVLLTGSAGFLGCHILKALLEIETGRIICIIRKGAEQDVITRLKAALVYYFENDYSEEFGKRIIVVEGDITDDHLLDTFKDINIDTIINCAASVKHFANDNSIEFVNVHGVEKLIELSKAKNSKMIQISTSSVPGAHTKETYMRNIKMHENQLFVIDDMDNQYIKSKYTAELRMLEAIQEGMRGKIIRVGNLMGRHSDGEFQSNMHTNAFLNGLRGFVNIGKCPISHATDPMSFSPIDCTAEAVVLLAGTNDIFTAFHAESRSTFDEMKVFEAINRCGLEVKPVSDEEYYSDFYRLMGDPEKNSRLSALLTNDRPDMHMVEADNRFTANVLYRLGFSWPFIDDEYLEKVIKSLDALDFFFMD